MKNHDVRNIFVILLASSTLLYSCTKSKTNDLQQAQLCLNKASASEARGCVSGLASDTSALGYSLKCSAIFVEQGFGSPASFITALNSINSSGSCTGGCSSTVNALYAFNFTVGDVTTTAGRQANIDAATEAFSVCSQADAKIYTQISSLFAFGTTAAMTAYQLTSGGAITQDNLEAAIASMDNTTVGNIVTTTYNAACTDTTNASDSTKAYCADLTAAIASGSTPADIGSCLKNKLQNPAYVCP